MSGSVEPPGNQAWHEAGHAVIAHLFGGRVRFVTLESDENELAGQAAIEWRGMSKHEVAAASACVALGGPVAEMESVGRAEILTAEQLDAWSYDWSEVLRCVRICVVDEGEHEVQIREWFATTRALLVEPEVAERLARVADALDAHGTLDDVLFLDAFA